MVSVSRSAPKEPVAVVQYETGDVAELAAKVLPGADTVVVALSPRGETAGRLVSLYRDLAQRSAAVGARYIQIGGFSSLRPAPNQPRFIEGEVPDEFRGEAEEGEATRVMLADSAPAELDWVFVSPAGGYGSWAAGDRTGTYRVGDEVALLTNRVVPLSPEPTSRSRMTARDAAVTSPGSPDRPAESRRRSRSRR